MVLQAVKHKIYKYIKFFLIKYLINRNSGEKMAELLVVRSKIKSYAEGCNVSGDFANTLSEKVVQLIKDAAGRAKANNRRTVQSKDL